MFYQTFDAITLIVPKLNAISQTFFDAITNQHIVFIRVVGLNNSESVRETCFLSWLVYCVVKVNLFEETTKSPEWHHLSKASFN